MVMADAGGVLGDRLNDMELASVDPQQVLPGVVPVAARHVE
jgi:hypothetical protein